MHEAYALAQLGRLEESVLAHFEVVGRFGDSAAPQIRAWVAAALYSIAVAQARLGRADEAVGRLRRPAGAVRRRARRRDPAAGRLGARGPRLERAGHGGSTRRSRTTTARSPCSGRAGPRSSASAAAQALAHKAWALKQLGRVDEAVETYEQLVERFGDDEHPALRRLVASALLSSGIALEQQGRYARAVAAYEDVFARFRADPDPEVRDTCARGASTTRACGSSAPGKEPEALAVFEQVVALYGDEPDGFARRRGRPRAPASSSDARASGACGRAVRASAASAGSCARLTSSYGSWLEVVQLAPAVRYSTYIQRFVRSAWNGGGPRVREHALAEVLLDELVAPRRPIAPRSSGTRLRPSCGSAGLTSASSRDRRGEVDVQHEVAVDAAAGGCHGTRTTSGTRIDSSYGQIFPPRRCSPQRKPLSLMKTTIVLSRTPVRCFRAATSAPTCRSTSISDRSWRPSMSRSRKCDRLRLAVSGGRAGATACRR